MNRSAVNCGHDVLYGRVGKRGQKPLPEGVTPEDLELGLRPYLIQAQTLRLRLDEHQQRLSQLPAAQQPQELVDAQTLLDQIQGNETYRRLQNGVGELRQRHQDMTAYLPVARNENAKAGVAELAAELEELLDEIGSQERDYFVAIYTELRQQVVNAERLVAALDLTPV